MPSRFSFAPVLLLGAVTTLGIAYVYTILTRPQVPDWKREEDPHEYGFPKWYGGSASYSTYDPAQADEGRDEFFEILLFMDLTRNSSSLPEAFYTYDLLKSRRDVSVRATGPFDPDWNAQLSTAENLENAGCRKVLWRIGEGEVDLGNACPDALIIDEAASQATMTPKVNARANITLLPEPQHMLSEDSSYEMLAATLGPGWKMGLLAHVLPAADPNVFYPTSKPPSHRAVRYFPRPTTSEKEWPVMPRGRQYTLNQPHSSIQPPNIGRWKSSDVDFYEQSSPFRGFWKTFNTNVAASLAQAGVCVFEGWQDGVLDTRVAQAMLSGCLVAAVPPDVEYGTLSHLILALKKSDKVLPADQIEEAMGKLSDSELKKKLLRSFIFARQAFVGPARLNQVFGIIDRWEQGARGYLFPHSFRWNCESKGKRPEWCD